jgi:hypothetical protein
VIAHSAAKWNQWYEIQVKEFHSAPTAKLDKPAAKAAESHLAGFIGSKIGPLSKNDKHTLISAGDLKWSEPS